MNASRPDAFSGFHPAVCFSFFLAAIVFTAFFLHPAYLASSLFASAAYHLTLKGWQGRRTLLGLCPLFLLVSALNPLFNPRGERVLFSLLSRPYTWEALCYGMAIAGMLTALLLWFSCWGEVITSDKLTSLFGNLIPALSLVLVLVLRLIPAFQRKAAQIGGGRRCIGTAAHGPHRRREQLSAGMAALSALTSWALEGSVVTADSMRARGYGTARRSCFHPYRFGLRDGVMLTVILVLSAAAGLSAGLGWTSASFTPHLFIPPVAGLPAVGWCAYTFLLLIPTLLSLREDLLWHYLKSKI